MDHAYSIGYTAFEGVRRIAAGELAQVVLEVKQAIDRGAQAPVLIFDNTTSTQIEIDFRGSVEDVLRRLPAPTPEETPDEASPASAQEAPGRGRPKLGVIAREVTLLPRHWAWLNSQPGGASVALRKLVDQARRANEQRDRIRQAQEATYRFMSVLAGDLPGFEEATRALYAQHRERFEALIAAWPVDVQDHASRLAAVVFAESVE